MMSNDINRYLGVLTLPLCSIEFLDKDLLNEYFEKETTTVKNKGDLREFTVNYVRNRYTIYSYDELYLYLDKWYLYPTFSADGERKNKDSFGIVFSHLKRLSRSLLSQRDGNIVYKYWDTAADEMLGGFAGSNKIYLFHCLNRMISLDVLSIIYMIENCKEINELNGYYGNIQISDMHLDRILERGIAENHLHCGVSASFLSIWDSLMLPLNAGSVSVLENFMLIYVSDTEKRNANFYLCLAGFIRAISLMLVELLRKNTCQQSIHFIYDKCATYTKHLSDGELKRIHDHFNTYKDVATYFIEEWEVLHSKFEIGSDFIRTIAGVDDSLRTSDENVFLYKIVSFLYEENDFDIEKVKLIKLLFINYLRIKNYFYNQMIQQKSVHGLDYFQQIYRNNSMASRKTAKLPNISRWERAIREQLQNQYLSKLELRTSIPRKENHFKKEMLAFLSAYRDILRKDYCKCEINDKGDMVFTPDKPFPKVGFTLHLIKSEQDFFPEKCLKQDADDNIHMQYGQAYKAFENQIALLKELRDAGFDKYLIGLDVASLESAIPTWVFAPIYKNARDSSNEKLQHGAGESFQSLGYTFHAGEDFRHMLSGLRRIDEVIQHLKFHAGDRIGHGIALGLDISDWYRSNPTVIIPRIEAFENYLWAYNRLSREMKVNLAFLEDRIYKLSKEIYGEISGLTINMLLDAYIQMFEENMFDRYSKLGCENCDDKGVICNSLRVADDNNGFIWNVENLLSSRHCKNYIRKMNEPIHYKISEAEVTIITEMQNYLKKLVNKQGIIIEINPSSNVAISSIDTLAKHQIYSINNLNYDFENIMVCINSDDPSVFNTNSSNELGYIYFGMLDKNIEREKILEWIDKLRRTGLDASFIRRKDSDHNILLELDTLLSE